MRAGKKTTARRRLVLKRVDPREEIPNDELLALMQKTDRLIRSGKKLKGYTRLEDMLDALS